MPGHLGEQPHGCRALPRLAERRRRGGNRVGEQIVLTAVARRTGNRGAAVAQQQHAEVDVRRGKAVILGQQELDIEISLVRSQAVGTIGIRQLRSEPEAHGRKDLPGPQDAHLGMQACIPGAVLRVALPVSRFLVQVEQLVTRLNLGPRPRSDAKRQLRHRHEVL